MNSTCARPPGADPAAGAAREACGPDRASDAAYAVIALAGLATGFLLGLLCAGDPYGARGAAPGPDSAVPHPRSLER